MKGYGQSQDFESTESFKFFTVFFYDKTFDSHEIYVHGVLKKWLARRKPSYSFFRSLSETAYLSRIYPFI